MQIAFVPRGAEVEGDDESDSDSEEGEKVGATGAKGHRRWALDEDEDTDVPQKDWYVMSVLSPGMS